jgi:hypothetical protein
LFDIIAKYTHTLSHTTSLIVTVAAAIAVVTVAAERAATIAGCTISRDIALRETCTTHEWILSTFMLGANLRQLLSGQLRRVSTCLL